MKPDAYRRTHAVGQGVFDEDAAVGGAAVIVGHGVGVGACGQIGQHIAGRAVGPAHLQRAGTAVGVKLDGSGCPVVELRAAFEHRDGGGRIEVGQCRFGAATRVGHGEGVGAFDQAGERSARGTVAPRVGEGAGTAAHRCRDAAVGCPRAAHVGHVESDGGAGTRAGTQAARRRHAITDEVARLRAETGDAVDGNTLHK